MKQTSNKIKQLSLTKTILLAAFFCFLAVSLFAPSQAHAVSYGPWFPKPGSGSSGINYQADVKPFNDTNISEITSFACVMPNGNPIGDEYDDEKLLANINLYASKVYSGQLEAGDFANNKYDGEIPDNLGFSTGKYGMQEWLRMMQTALKEEYVFYPLNENMNIVNTSGGDGQPLTYFQNPGNQFGFSWPTEGNGYTISGSLNNIDVDLDRKDYVNRQDFKKSRYRLAFLLNPQARTPLNLNDKMPEGCLITPISPLGGVNIGDLFSGDIGDQALNILLYIPGKLVEESYGLIAPLAFKYTFWTPHSERGDLIWNTPDVCDYVMKSFIRAPNAAERKDIRQGTQYCSNGTPLGFSKIKTDTRNQNSLYLNIARFVQWLVSGFYFLILFTAATLFIFRGNRSNSMNVLHMLPRLVLAVVLTLFSGFIIGAVISFSNLLVQMFFQSNDVSTVGAVNTALQQAGPIVGGGEFLERLVNIVASGIALFCFVLFLATVIVRQIGLIILVIIAPLAFLCLINPSWEANFWKWIRALLAIAVVPALSAMILKISMSINPLIIDPEGSYGGVQGILGIIILLATLYAMTKIMKSGREFIMGQSGTASGMMSGAQQSRNNRNNRSAIDGASGGSYGSGGDLGAGDRGELIPAGRQSSGGGSNADGYGRAMLNAGKEKVSGIGSKTVSKDLNQGSPTGKMENWINNKKGLGDAARKTAMPSGKTEITEQAYNQGVSKYNSAFQHARSQGLSNEHAKLQAAHAAGGEYTQENGRYFVKPPQQSAPENISPQRPAPSRQQTAEQVQRRKQSAADLRAKVARDKQVGQSGNNPQPPVIDPRQGKQATPIRKDVNPEP
jgi:hypothetical protein